MMCEDSKIMIELYNHLKNIYNFNPIKIIHDFAFGNISAINTVIKISLKFIQCFFPSFPSVEEKKEFFKLKS